MAERKRITLVYAYSENWVGGAYYILNIIKAVDLLEDKQKPALTIVKDFSTPSDLVEQTNYPYLEIKSVDFKLSFFKKAVNKIMFGITLNRLFKIPLPGNNIYPFDDRFVAKKGAAKYYWIPDLQDKHLPGFFSQKELNDRAKFYKHIVKFCHNIVFSSETAKADFDKFYPENQCKKVVLKFASIQNEDFSSIDMESLKSKFGIKKPYFIVSNQFWGHKNHQVVLSAVKQLKDKGFDVQLLLTGKEYDYRNPNYTTDLKKFVEENGLGEDILFLGFIGRGEQLQLMANSLAIVQPSSFEGWSTVVEDAKALNKFIIVSDIPVHLEQIADNCAFFEMNNPANLALVMENYLLNPPAIIQKDTKKDILNFATSFVNTFN